MRWLALWLFLTFTYAAGWLVSKLLLGEPLEVTGAAVAHLIFVPPVQALALAMLRVFRRTGDPE